MVPRLLLAILLASVLSGCFSPPEAPDDAVQDTDPSLPGLTLSAWTEDGGDRIRLHALLRNDGDQSYDIRVGCEHPWRSQIVAPDGTLVPYREVQEESNCAPVWDVVRPKQHKDTLYSWDFQAHDVEDDTASPVPAGEYTWRIAFTLRDRDQELQVEIPIAVQGDGDGDGDAPPTLAGFSLSLRTGTVPGGHGVNVTVRNEGTQEPAFWTGCSTEWAWRLLDAAGDEVPLEPMGQCDGFSETTFPPGHVHHAEFFWDGQRWDGEANEPAPAGEYTWEITFGLQGTGGDVLRETADFSHP